MRILHCGLLAACTLLVSQASAQTVPNVTLTRLECGTPAAPIDVNTRFSDTSAYKNLILQFVFSCYLIRHGDEYMLWDTGHAASAGAVAPKVSLTDQLAQLKVTPEQVKFVGISHYHPDHIGGAAAFGKSTLLIGKGDWDVIASPKPPAGVNPQLLANWITGGSAVEQVPTDKDVFGDGTVVMLYTPGHTPGHHSLLVKLPTMGSVILSGDFVHFNENFESSGVPFFNTDRAQTIASIDRIRKLAANLKATIIIQHDARDIGKLPAFPAAAN
jgi:glyoxylase-like metal-dependent hydrolase (beta-lactamase superfamily II)